MSMRRASRWLIHTAAAIVLLAVFLMYLHPDFIVTLSNQVWSCF
jgi:hypothetical protein